MPDPERTLMGAIDQAYRHERDMHLMVARENAKLRAANEAWMNAVVDLEAAARTERALTDDAAKAAEMLLTEGDESGLDAWLVRYREARP